MLSSFKHDGHVRVTFELKEFDRPTLWTATGELTLDPGEELAADRRRRTAHRSCTLWVELGDGSTFYIWQVVPGIAVAGVGSGVVIAALFSIILAAVRDAEIGSASGVLTAVQSIASSIGVAVFGSTFFSAISDGSPAEAFRSALVIQAGLLLGFFVLSFLFPRKSRTNSHGVEASKLGQSTTDHDLVGKIREAFRLCRFLGTGQEWGDCGGIRRARPIIVLDSTFE